MRKIIICAAAFAAVVTVTQVSVAHDWRSHFTTEVPFMVILKSGYLNLRSGPGVEHPVLASLKNGTRGLTLETCVQHAKWCRVSDGAGKRGWVLSKFIGGYAT